MPDKVFFDTNVLIYAITLNDPRAAIAEALLAGGSGIISVQVLNEFATVARRKLDMSWQEITVALAAFRSLCAAVVPVDVATHEAALSVAERYRIGIHDALIVAAAQQTACATLYTEDLQDGQRVDGRLTVRNPFRVG